MFSKKAKAITGILKTYGKIKKAEFDTNGKI